MRTPTNMGLKRRMEGAFIFLMLLFFTLALRLTWIQGVQQQHFTRLADSIHRRTLELPAARGPITDRLGQELVSNIAAKTLIANPRAVPNKAETAQTIARYLGGDPQNYLAALNQTTWKDGKPRWFVYLARAANRNKVDKLMALKIPGLEAQDATKRIHPSGSLAAQATGYVDIDDIGREGLERTLNTFLKGKPGEIKNYVDAIGRPIPDTDQYYLPPVNGSTVKLTLDANIQEFVEAELKKIIEQFKPEGATAIVEDVHTGQILALANAPTFDPNHPASSPPQYRRDRAIQDRYEPGSTFKSITLGAALEEHLPDTTVVCTGSKMIGKHTIREALGERHGLVDLHHIEQYSCNIGAATIGMRLGAETLYRYIKKFGYLEKTGIELTGEEKGTVGMKPDKWPAIKTANVAFGQGVDVTPIEMIRMYSAIADEGVMLPPTLVLSVNGKRYHRPEPPRRIVNPQTAHKLRDFMMSVVVGKQGTGHNAKIPDYTVAGKTGTAQLVQNGHYLHGAFVSSFIGFVPATHPRIAILVATTHPTQGGHFGGTVSAPAFREIARQTMAYLRIPPDAQGDYRDGAKLNTWANWERQYPGVEELPAVAALTAESSAPTAPPPDAARPAHVHLARRSD